MMTGLKLWVTQPFLHNKREEGLILCQICEMSFKNGLLARNDKSSSIIIKYSGDWNNKQIRNWKG